MKTKNEQFLTKSERAEEKQLLREKIADLKAELRDETADLKRYPALVRKEKLASQRCVARMRKQFEADMREELRDSAGELKDIRNQELDTKENVKEIAALIAEATKSLAKLAR